MTLYLKKMNTPLARYEYIWMKLNCFSYDVIKEYGLNEITIKDGWVYV